MKLIPRGRLVLGACLCLAVAGCGNTAAKSPAPITSTAGTAHSTPTATAAPVTPAVTLYAQAVQPVVRSGITQATTLIKAMQSTPTDQLGRVCVQAAGGLSGNRDAFNSAPAPVAAKSVRSVARQAYQTILSATDECGIASDSSSPGNLAQAAKDLQTGISRLNSVQGTLSGWAAKH